ncbi:MAG TPA: tetratricopeptide repeat protein [Geminicoccaceae bacterium]|nr:tetratricopeptide repeat protein [Geminicoccaceae bacterium]
MDRKLAVILAADVVGYSALMERDEAGTHRRLVAGRKELFEPTIARQDGRIFKLMGDGLLAEFGSVVDAVECAVSLQRGLTERNAAAADDQRIQVRIGINLGEVIVEGDDRYGEGVNIAARLEQLAEPGGIWVSAKVAREVEKKLAFGFESMGEQRVKNIAEPVAAYRVRLDGPPARSLRLAQPSRLRLAAVAVATLLLAGGAVTWFTRTPAPEAVVATGPAVAKGKPSLVVLPFANLSDDEAQGYLADGNTEDLTTELARIPGLFVISRNAAFTYKGKAVQPAQIAKELGVRYIVEGSTRRAGDDMRLNAQLIDAETGGHVWAERFDGQWGDVFALQDKLVGSIAGALKLRLLSGQGKSDTAGGTANPAAYDAYLRGREIYLRDNTPEEFAQAAAYFQTALALDPDFGQAWAQLAWIYWDADDQRTAALGLSSWREISTKLYESLEAAAKHPSPLYYQLVAELLVRERRSDEAIAILHKAVALDPSDAWNYEELSQALIFNGRPREGRAYLDAAMRVDPGWGEWRHYQDGLAAFGEGRFEDAVVALEKMDPHSPNPWPKFFGLQVLLWPMDISAAAPSSRRSRRI